MSYNNLLVSNENNVLVITINRPASHNSLSIETLKDLDHVFDMIYKSNDVKAVIITGAGRKSFVSGADINEFRTLTPEGAADFAINGQRTVKLIEDCPKPVIAAINGYALGGGCELAMACHLRYASENALFGQPEINLGIIPGYGGTQRLLQYISKSRAMEMLLLGKPINAQEALASGLVNGVVPLDQLMSRVQEIAAALCAKPPVALAGIIRSVNAFYSTSAYNEEIRRFAECINTRDFTEGVSAFIEKRTAKFTGS